MTYTCSGSTQDEYVWEIGSGSDAEILDRISTLTKKNAERMVGLLTADAPAEDTSIVILTGIDGFKVGDIVYIRDDDSIEKNTLSYITIATKTLGLQYPLSSTYSISKNAEVYTMVYDPQVLDLQIMGVLWDGSASNVLLYYKPNRDFRSNIQEVIWKLLTQSLALTSVRSDVIGYKRTLTGTLTGTVSFAYVRSILMAEALHTTISLVTQNSFVKTVIETLTAIEEFSFDKF